LLTGGAVLLGGAVLGSQGRAEAADGSSLIVGRSTNTAKSTTKLTTSGNNQSLNVTNTNTGTQAHGILSYTKNGYGLLGESTGSVGAVIRTHNKAKPALLVENKGGTDTSQTPGISSFTGPGGAQKLAGTGYGRGALEGAGLNGVIGVSTANGSGVIGHADGEGWHSGYAVFGRGINGSWGLVGEADPPGFALRTVGLSQLDGNTTVVGDLYVSGSLSKAGGSFRIDHPQDPANKYLSHSFVESPDMKNVYDGVVTADAGGAATVKLPDWFATLNRDFRYQLTALDGAAPDLHVSKRLRGNEFSIGGAKPHQDISWQLTGIRQDAWANENRIPVEENKPQAERGTYLYPKGFGESKIVAR